MPTVIRRTTIEKTRTLIGPHGRTVVKKTRKVVVEAQRSARAAGLHYVCETIRGIRRERRGKQFVYRDAAGRVVKDPVVLERIRALAIPPAWEDVWICPAPHGHIQAVGYDARGRKQYRYHSRWQETRDKQKYHKLISFAEALPAIRRQVSRDLQLRGLPREKVLAAVVRLLELTGIRVGNDEYARHNKTFGLTTIHNGHARVKGSRIRFDFRGKHNIEHEIELRDSQLARVVARCQELPGQELFGYLDEDGQERDVGSSDVNRYLQKIGGHRFSAKDFRTWTGTVHAAWELAALGPPATKTAAKRGINQAIARVAERLGNTRAVCRKCYVHPAILEAYEAGTLPSLLARGSAGRSALPREEATVLEVLRSASRRAGKRLAG